LGESSVFLKIINPEKMSEEKKVKFISNHSQLMIMRKPRQVTRTVNGLTQIVVEDQPPFKFENGDLSVTETEAKEIRTKRGYGRLYKEVPAAVAKVASKEKKAEKTKPLDENPETKPDDSNIKTTIVEEVTDFNSAMNYLKEEFGLEHKDVNSKDKVFAQADLLKIEFPNFQKSEE